MAYSTKTREPEVFAAGDTLYFEKSIRDYPPSGGYALEYFLTSEAGQKVATVNSAVNPDGSGFILTQNAFAAALDAGTYSFDGYAVNAGTGERHRIYSGMLNLVPDLADGTASGPITTFAQQMVAQLQTQYSQLAQSRFESTDVQRNSFIEKKQGKILEDLKYWTDKVENEADVARAAAGRRTRNISAPVFNIG